MYGIISGNREGKARKVYVNTALVGVIFTLINPAIYVYLFHSGKFSIEIVGFGFLISLLTFGLGKIRRIDNAFFFRWMEGYFLLYSVHLIFLAAVNQFSLLFLMNLVFGIHLCALSFRRRQGIIVYLLVVGALWQVALWSIDDLNLVDKQPLALIGFFSVIVEFFLATAKLKVVKHMRIHRGLLLALSHKTENAIFLTNTAGEIMDMNQRAVDLFEYSCEELYKSDFSQLRKITLSALEVEQGLAKLNNNKFWIHDVVLVKKSGEEINTHISIGHIENEGARYFVYRVRDTSEEIRLRSELITAKEKAEEAAIIKAQFLATMSHEIRTPLNGVIGMASLLQQTKLDYKQKEYADTIQKSGASLMVLINDILDFSKLEQGKMELKEDRVDIRESITDVIDVLRTPAQSKGIHIYVDVENRIASHVLIDELRLRQVLLNFVGNAIKFTETGSVKLSVKVKEDVGIRVKLEFCVEDTGIGIAEDRLDRLFKSFSQVDASHSRKYGGTGLGLSISKQIVELMGGEVSVESQIGKGTKFHFSIWAAHADTVVGKEQVDAILWQPEKYSSMRILIAEDNFVNQKVLEYMLQNLGLRADLASNGLEVVEMHSKNPYDLIFMDVQMPMMDGIEACRFVRAQNQEQPYIVAMTANHTDKDRNNCMEVGMNQFISKPFVIEQVQGVFLGVSQTVF
jgi:PAS domain S-box-containing protein